MLNKKTVKTVFSMVVALVLIAGVLVSCGSSRHALTSAGVDITEDMYRYWYIQLKDYYIASYSDVVDSTEFWLSIIPESDTTYGDFIDEKIRTQIDFYLAGNVLFNEYNLSSIEKDTWKTVTATVDEEIDDGINAFGSRSEYDKYLDEKYGIDSSTLRSIKLAEQKFYLAYNYLFDAETGIEAATDAEIEAFYVANYARIKYYMILKNFEYRTDASGNRVMNSKGEYIQDALTEDEKQEKAEYAASVYESIKNGESIDKYIKQDYPDMVTNAPNGYYLIKNEYYGYLFTNTIVNATFDAEIGDIVFCENEDAFFIVERCSLPEKAYNGADKAQFSEIGSYAVNDKFEEKFKTYIDAIERDTEICDRYSVMTVD